MVQRGEEVDAFGDARGGAGIWGFGHLGEVQGQCWHYEQFL